MSDLYFVQIVSTNASKFSGIIVYNKHTSISSLVFIMQLLLDSKSNCS